ncbi:MAG TPA: hypothetical protein VFQ82_09200 [Stellaceae bacterium]|nr:hypothetical protein [Stellaceae bacterium]
MPEADDIGFQLLFAHQIAQLSKLAVRTFRRKDRQKISEMAVEVRSRLVFVARKDPDTGAPAGVVASASLEDLSLR